MSQHVPVPAQQAVAIDYPGYVENVQAALDTMGGLQRVSDAYNSGGSGYVQVSCRPGDALAHPIFAERQHRNALLLRITKPEGGGAMLPAVRAEVVARVNVGYRFAGMADFQYTEGPGKAEDLSDYPEVDGPFGKERAPLTVPPPLFSKQDEPMDYGFRQRPEPGPAITKQRPAQQQQQQPQQQQPQQDQQQQQDTTVSQQPQLPPSSQQSVPQEPAH